MTYEQASKSITSLPLNSYLQDVLLQAGIIGVGRLTRATADELRSYGMTEIQIAEVSASLSSQGLSLAMESWERNI